MFNYVFLNPVIWLSLNQATLVKSGNCVHHLFSMDSSDSGDSLQAADIVCIPKDGCVFSWADSIKGVHKHRIYSSVTASVGATANFFPQGDDNISNSIHIFPTMAFSWCPRYGFVECVIVEIRKPLCPLTLNPNEIGVGLFTLWVTIIVSPVGSFYGRGNDIFPVFKKPLVSALG